MKYIKYLLFIIIMLSFGWNEVSANELTCYYIYEKDNLHKSQEAYITLTYNNNSNSFTTGKVHTQVHDGIYATEKIEIVNLTQNYDDVGQYTLEKDEQGNAICPKFLAMTKKGAWSPKAVVLSNDSSALDGAFPAIAINSVNAEVEYQDSITTKEAVKDNYDTGVIGTEPAVCYYKIFNNNNTVTPAKLELSFNSNPLINKFQGKVTYIQEQQSQERNICNMYDECTISEMSASDGTFYGGTKYGAEYIDIMQIRKHPTVIKYEYGTNLKIQKTYCPQYVVIPNTIILSNAGAVVTNNLSLAKNEKASKYASVITEEEYNDLLEKKQTEQQIVKELEENGPKNYDDMDKDSIAVCYYELNDKNGKTYNRAIVTYSYEKGVFGIDSSLAGAKFVGKVSTEIYKGERTTKRFDIKNMYDPKYNACVNNETSFLEVCSFNTTVVDVEGIAQDAKNSNYSSDKCPQYLVMIEADGDHNKSAVTTNDKNYTQRDYVQYAERVKFEDYFRLELEKLCGPKTTNEDGTQKDCIPGESIELTCENNGIFGDPTFAGDTENPPSIAYIINQILAYVRILVPVAIILLGSLDFAKAVIASKEDEMKASQNRFAKRIVIGVAIFLVPTFVNIIMNVARYAWGDNYPSCTIEEITKKNN